MSPVRRLAAVALIAAGLALELGPGWALISLGAGFGWSGADPRAVLAAVRRLRTRRKGPRTHASRATADGPAAASTGYGQAEAA